MRGPFHNRLITFVFLAIFLSACAQPSAPTPAPTSTKTPASPTPTPTATITPTPTETPYPYLDELNSWLDDIQVQLPESKIKVNDEFYEMYLDENYLGRLGEKDEDVGLWVTDPENEEQKLFLSLSSSYVLGGFLLGRTEDGEFAYDPIYARWKLYESEVPGVWHDGEYFAVPDLGPGMNVWAKEIDRDSSFALAGKVDGVPQQVFWHGSEQWINLPEQMPDYEHGLLKLNIGKVTVEVEEEKQDKIVLNNNWGAPVFVGEVDENSHQLDWKDHRGIEEEFNYVVRNQIDEDNFNHVKNLQRRNAQITGIDDVTEINAVVAETSYISAYEMVVDDGRIKVRANFITLHGLVSTNIEFYSESTTNPDKTKIIGAPGTDPEQIREILDGLIMFDPDWNTNNMEYLAVFSIGSAADSAKCGAQRMLNVDTNSSVCSYNPSESTLDGPGLVNFLKQSARTGFTYQDAISFQGIDDLDGLTGNNPVGILD